MKFLQKRSVAVTLTVLMVVLSLFIGFRNTGDDTQSVDVMDWASENYRDYEEYIRDESGILDNDVRQELSVQNAAADYAYSTVCALVTLDELPEGKEDAVADSWFEILDLGEMDALLLLSTQEQAWYFYYGADFDWYIDGDLEDIFYDSADKLLSRPNAGLPELYEDLADWYDDTLPAQQHETVGSAVGSFLRTVGGIILFFIVIVVLLVLLAAAASGSTRRVVRGPRVIYTGPTIIHRPHIHRTPPPPPGPMHRPGGSYRPPSRPSGGSRPMSGGSRGGFGGSSRPSGGSRGGFGGSRGGGSRGGMGGRR